MYEVVDYNNSCKSWDFMFDITSYIKTIINKEFRFISSI